MNYHSESAVLSIPDGASTMLHVSMAFAVDSASIDAEMTK
jgi:hypothetical protein